MALTSKSLFLYGYQVTSDNSSLDFRASSGDPSTGRSATLRQGSYSLTALANEIIRSMQALDSVNKYTVNINRNVNGGLENRVSISSSGAFFQLLFGTGPRVSTSVAPLIGFPQSDKTGATSYTGSATSGITLVPDFVGYSFLSPDFFRQIQGTVNVSSSGVKEAVIFQIMKFWQVQFKYETLFRVTSQWQPLMTWLIQQRLFEFTPQVSDPTTFYEGTLEKTAADGKGLAYKMTEMLPKFPNLYDTGLSTFRVNQ